MPETKQKEAEGYDKYYSEFTEEREKYPQLTDDEVEDAFFAALGKDVTEVEEKLETLRDFMRRKILAQTPINWLTKAMGQERKEKKMEQHILNLVEGAKKSTTFNVNVSEAPWNGEIQKAIGTSIAATIVQDLIQRIGANPRTLRKIQPQEFSEAIIDVRDGKDKKSLDVSFRAILISKILEGKLVFEGGGTVEIPIPIDHNPKHT